MSTRSKPYTAYWVNAVPDEPQACQAILNGDCDSAIVAGTNLILTPSQTISQTEAGVLSPTGQCRTFDASANGYARGEAINAIYIKKLSDAIRDHDPIRAIVRATAVNCDGRSAGLSQPNPEAHERLIRRAYARAGLTDFSETPFVEVHGTGTPSGDPLELQAISKVFGGDRDTYVGSVKANVGHGEGASGITSIIKAVMALEHQTIPPQVNFSTPNPKIPFEEARLVVPLEPIPWPSDRPQRISVNSFGITGANAHAIIESAASYGIHRGHAMNGIGDSVPNGVAQHTSESALLLFSATNAESLKKRASDIRDHALSLPDKINDLAYTLAVRRDHLPHRAFSVTNGVTMGDFIAADKAKQAPQPVFVFTGQGAQWPAMGKELVEIFPSFQDDILRFSQLLGHLPHPPPWDLTEELLKFGPKSRLDKAQFAQPLCTALQVALVNLLRDLGVVPTAVVGHSSGEIAAAYAAGAITAEEAIIIAYYRGFTATSSSQKGAMAAVGIGRAEAILYLEQGVVIACDNSPNSVTLSGDEDALDRMTEQMKFDDDGLFIRRLKTDGMAYHSHHMLEVGNQYEELLKPLVMARTPAIPLYSTVTGRLAEDRPLGPSYWRENLESPVKFYPAVRNIVESLKADLLFLEIGPHSAMAGPLRQIFKATPSKSRLTYLPTLTRGKNAHECILEMCGNLFLQTVPVRFDKLTPGCQTLTDVPNYPWRHDISLWAENRVVKEW
jgi:acyl transferase domain-containing protein